MNIEFIKKFGLYAAGMTINSYCLNKAVDANNKYNLYLSKLAPEDLEKLRARDWYLQKNGYFFGSGHILAEKMEIDKYNALSVEQKNRILMQYRWNEFRHSQKP